MCYYIFIVFTCQDGKWGQFSHYCRRGTTLGETCGLKLATRNITEPNQCSICQELDKKYRQRQAEVGRFKRWERESRIDQHQDEEEGRQILDSIQAVDKAIRELHIQRINLIIQDEFFPNSEELSSLKKRPRLDEETTLSYGSYYIQKERDEFFTGRSQTDNIDLSDPSSDMDSSPRKVLCPYYLRHPRKHKKGSCMGPGFDNMARLKYVTCQSQDITWLRRD
jgi:hypothetical protein